MTEGTSKGAIISNGKKKAPQYNALIEKLILYYGKQGYQYLLEVIRTLKDKPPDNNDFNEPDPNTTQWKEEKLVPILNGNGSVLAVNDVVQKEKQMVVDNAKREVGMAKWSKKHKANLKAGEVFVQNKESVLSVMLSNLHPVIVQRMKSIKEYKQIEKKKDLIGTLCILKEICFADWDGRHTFDQCPL